MTSSFWRTLPTAYRYLLVTIPLLIVLCTVSVGWIDRPLAVWLTNTNHSFGISKEFGLATLLTQLTYCILVALFVIYFILRIQGIQGKIIDCLYLFNQSIVFAYFIKMTLQYLFGRYVPRYSESSVLLFVRNARLYGFHWLQAGSFPSGHMTLFAAGATALCLYYKRLRLVMMVIGILLASLLLFFSYHFLSDIIAGTYLGFTITLALYYLACLEKRIINP